MTRPCNTDPSAAAKSRRRAFTLIELLVAIAVASLLLVLLINVIARALLISQLSAESIAAYTAASSAIDLVATDLESAASNRQPYYSLQALPDPAYPDATYASLFAGTNQPMRLILNTMSSQDSAQPSPNGGTYFYPDSGQVRAVCYRVGWQNPLGGTAASPSPTPTPNPASSIFALYRQVATTADTFRYVIGHADAQGRATTPYVALYKNTSWTGAVGSGSPPTNPPPASTPTADEFMVANVVDFQIALYANALPTGTGGSTQTTTGSLKQPPDLINANTTSGGSIPYHNTIISGTGTFIASDTDPTALGTVLYGYGQVVYAEVSITVLEDTGAKLWRDGSGTGTTSPAALKQKYGHTLTRKVTLRNPY